METNGIKEIKEISSLNILCKSWLETILNNITVSIHSLQMNNSVSNRIKQTKYLKSQKQLILILLNVKSGKTKLQGFNHKL